MRKEKGIKELMRPYPCLDCPYKISVEVMQRLTNKHVPVFSIGFFQESGRHDLVEVEPGDVVRFTAYYGLEIMVQNGRPDKIWVGRLG